MVCKGKLDDHTAAGGEGGMSGQRTAQRIANDGDIPERLVEAAMVAYIKDQIATGGDEWVPVEDLDLPQRP